MKEKPAISLDAEIATVLGTVSSATLSTVLLEKGIRNVWIRGAVPLGAGQKQVVGRAFTLRFVPGRDDLATPESWASGRSNAGGDRGDGVGVIVVADAMGTTDAGSFGDILCARIKRRGVTALVTDGVIRDVVGVRAT